MDPLRGVNLRYFFDAYGHDLAPNALTGAGPRDVDAIGIYRPLIAARELGFLAVRIWLCEGGEGILMNADSIIGVSPVLIESVAVIQECASLCGLRIYWTLLDGHSAEHDGDALSATILRTPERTAQFAECVAAPLMRRLDPHLTLALEIVNEPETLIARGKSNTDRDAIEWNALGVAIKTIGEAVRSERGATIVTAGSQFRALSSLWASAAGLNAVDVHPDGDSRIPSRSETLREAAISASETASAPLLAVCSSKKDPVNPAEEGYAAVFLGRHPEQLVAAEKELREEKPR